MMLRLYFGQRSKICFQTIVCTSLNRSYGTFSTSDGKYYDAVIAGGGMVGTSLACALGCSSAFQNKTVCLLESAPEIKIRDWSRGAFESRTSAIAPASRDFLKEIGVWEKITSRRYHPFSKMHVWDRCSNSSISFDAANTGEDYIAYLIENNAIIESCAERSKELKQLDIHYLSRIIDICYPEQLGNETCFEDLVTVTLEDGRMLKTKLLIGADGFNSFVRQKANLSTYDYDYGQSAIVAILKVKTEPSNQTAWQRFLPTGPIAVLPIGDNHSNLVWSTSTNEAQELMRLTDSELANRINEALHAPPSTNIFMDLVSGVMKSVTSTLQPGSFASKNLIVPPTVESVEGKSRGMFPLGLKHALHYVKSRTVLVGDSAHRIHPMAGQGVNLGFADVKCLVQLVEDSIMQGKDFGVLENLLSYETDRQRHSAAMIGVINSLNHLYSTNQLPLVLLRSIGLHTTDVLAPLKDRIVKYAMG